MTTLNDTVLNALADSTTGIPTTLTALAKMLMRKRGLGFSEAQLEASRLLRNVEAAHQMRERAPSTVAPAPARRPAPAPLQSLELLSLTSIARRLMSDNPTLSFTDAQAEASKIMRSKIGGRSPFGGR